MAGGVALSERLGPVANLGKHSEGGHSVPLRVGALLGALRGLAHWLTCMVCLDGSKQLCSGECEPLTDKVVRVISVVKVISSPMNNVLRSIPASFFLVCSVPLV